MRQCAQHCITTLQAWHGLAMCLQTPHDRVTAHQTGAFFASRERISVLNQHVSSLSGTQILRTTAVCASVGAAHAPATHAEDLSFNTSVFSLVRLLRTMCHQTRPSCGAQGMARRFWRSWAPSRRGHWRSSSLPRWPLAQQCTLTSASRAPGKSLLNSLVLRVVCIMPAMLWHTR